MVALILLFMISSTYNSPVVDLDESLNNARSNLKTDLQRRLDLVPNLMETVKTYASHERATLKAVAKKIRQQVTLGDL